MRSPIRPSPEQLYPAKEATVSNARASRAAVLVLAAATMVLAGCGDDGDPASTRTTTTASTTSSEPTTSATTTTTTYSPAPQVFDNAAMQDAVHQILTESYRVKRLGVVTCPPDKPVRKGLKFSCKAMIDGKRHLVLITVTTNDGAYDVGLPRKA